MFGRSLLINLGTVLLCWSNGVSVAMPVRRSVTQILARDPIPLVPGASIHPAHVNLLDRHENSERQIAEAVQGTPNHESLVNNLASSKQTFEDSIKSIAVLARADTTLSVPIPSSTAASASASPSDSASSSASVTASASTTSALPPTSVNTDVPVVTVVTQIGTSVVVVASQGVTSTITLATLTNIPNSTLSSTASSGTSTSGSASVTSPAASMPSATSTTP